eukprot:gene8408-9889_t
MKLYTITYVVLLTTLLSCAAASVCTGNTAPKLVIDQQDVTCSSGYHIESGLFKVVNFNDYASIITDPPIANRAYEDDGLIFSGFESTTYTVTGTTASGDCTSETISVRYFAASQDTPSSQLCQYSVAKMSIVPLSASMTYTLNGELVTLPFVAPVGLNQLAMNSSSDESCVLDFTILSEKTTTYPIIQSSPEMCTLGDGKLTVKSPERYSSIELYKINSTVALQEQGKGVYTGLSAGSYVVWLADAECGVQRVPVTLNRGSPTIKIDIDTASSKCGQADYLVASLINFPKDPNPVFVVNDQPSPSNRFQLPFKEADIAYTSNGCSSVTQVTPPTPDITITHSFTSAFSCSSPVTTVALAYSGLSKLNILDTTNSSTFTLNAPNPTFQAIYGHNYTISDSCQSNLYKFDVPRILPIYSFTKTRTDCLANVTLTVHNYASFSSITIVDTMNTAKKFTSTNGVFTGLYTTVWEIQTVEAGCIGPASIASTLTTDMSLDNTELNESLFTFNMTNIVPIECKVTGSATIVPTYDGTYVGAATAVTFETNYPTTISFIYPGCQKAGFVHLSNIPSKLPTITITVVKNATCKYSRDAIVRVASPAANPIVRVSTKDFDLEKVPGTTDLYHVNGGVKDFTIYFDYTTECNDDVRINNFNVPYGSPTFIMEPIIVAQDTTNCTVASGSITIPNTDKFTKIKLFESDGTSEIPSTSAGKFTGLSGGAYVLQFTTLDNTVCNGSVVSSMPLYVPSLPEAIFTYTTTHLPNCNPTDDSNDSVLTIKVANAQGVRYPRSRGNVEPNGKLNDDHTLTGLTFGLDSVITYTSDYCLWKYNLNVPSVTITPAVSVEYARANTCDDVKDAIVRFKVNKPYLSIDEIRVLPESDRVPFFNNTITNFSINNAIMSFEVVLGECKEILQVQFDYAERRRPQFSMVKSTCPNLNGKIIFTQETLDTFDLYLEDTLAPVNGEFVLGFGESTWLYYVDRIDGCKGRKRIDLSDLFVDTTSTPPSFTVTRETCLGTKDAQVTVAKIPGHVIQLFRQLGDQVEQYERFMLPSTTIGDNIVFDKLGNGTYYLRKINNVTSCTETYMVEVGNNEPVLSVDWIGACNSEFKATITAKVSSPSDFTDITFTLNGETRSIGTFGSLVPGTYLVGAHVGDSRCVRQLSSVNVVVTEKPITINTQLGACQSLTVAPVGGNSPLYRIAIQALDTNEIVGTQDDVDSATFDNLLAGDYIIHVTDRASGCSERLQYAMATCYGSSSLSSSTSSTSSNDEDDINIELIAGLVVGISFAVSMIALVIYMVYKHISAPKRVIKMKPVVNKTAMIGF